MASREVCLTPTARARYSALNTSPPRHRGWCRRRKGRREFGSDAHTSAQCSQGTWKKEPVSLKLGPNPPRCVLIAQRHRKTPFVSHMPFPRLERATPSARPGGLRATLAAGVGGTIVPEHSRGVCPQDQWPIILEVNAPSKPQSCCGDLSFRISSSATGSLIVAPAQHPPCCPNGLRPRKSASKQGGAGTSFDVVK